MTNHNNIPALRFSEFVGEWEVKKLGEIGQLIGGGTPSSEIEAYWNGNIPWISSSDLTEGNINKINVTRYITENAISNSATKLIPKNSILVISRVGVGKFVINEVDLCTSQDFTNIIIKKNDVHFLAYNFLAFPNKFKRISQGTSIKGFTGKDMKIIKINLPTLPEQQKIANFLTAIDKKIQQLRQKHALLTDYKKGIMQQIFKQDIRFRKDDGGSFGDWEVKRLGEIGQIITGKTPSTKNRTLWNGNIQFITPTDILDNQKYQYTTNRYVQKTPKMKILPKNTIIYTCIASIGKMCLSVKPCITNQQINSLIPNEEFNNEYIYYYLLYLTPKIKSLQANTTLPIINKTEFSKFKIQLPSLPEQQKIAKFLSSIDGKIGRVGEQIAEMEGFKKGLLQGLFV